MPYLPFRLRTLSFLVAAALAGCAGHVPPATQAPPVAQQPPPPMPAELVRADLTAFLEHKVLQPVSLPVLERGEVTLAADGPRTEPGVLRVWQSMPGGASEDIYVDGANRVWVVQQSNQVHVPPGSNIIISATRTFETAFALSGPYTFGGVIRLVESPDQLTPARRAPVRAPVG